MRTRQKRVATDTWRSLGCRTTPLEHWSRRKPTVEPRWAKQQTKKLRPKPTKINSFMSGPSLSLTPESVEMNRNKIITFVYVTSQSQQYLTSQVPPPQSPALAPFPPPPPHTHTTVLSVYQFRSSNVLSYTCTHFLALKLSSHEQCLLQFSFDLYQWSIICGNMLKDFGSIHRQ